MSRVVNEVGHDFSNFTGNGIAVVDFWANWCGPCRMLAPILDKVADALPTVSFGKVNIDEYPEIAKGFNVSSIPNVCIFKNGVLVDRIIGVRPEQELIKVIQSHI